MLYLKRGRAPDAAPAAPALREEAIQLARLLASLMPDEPEATGLLALLRPAVAHLLAAGR